MYTVSQKKTLFLVSGLKDENLIQKPTYAKTEACKLCSRVFWIFLPNVIQIDPYNFELYRFKICTFFGDTVMELHLTSTGCYLPYGITQC